MNTTYLIIGIAVVAILLLILLVIIGLNRKKAKTVSFEKKEEAPKELTQQEKSGNYQATGGFNFAPAQADEREPELLDNQRLAAPEPVIPEPVEVAEPLEHEEEAPFSLEGAAEATDYVPEEPVEIEVTEPVAEKLEEIAEEPEPQPEIDTPAEVEAEAEEEPEIQEVVEEQERAEEEAEEAAAAASVTAGAVEAALEQTPVPTTAPEPAPAPAEVEEIAPAAGRIGRLRGRLARSQNVIGQGVLGILSAGDLDEDAWEEIEDTLLMADLGTTVTMNVVDSLREKIAEHGVSSEAEARAMLRETLIEACHPEMDRSIKAMPYQGKPAVILIVGVNGTGKTTTTGKLARVLVSMGHKVLLGAADTFRAAAADQLETWGRRVGATTVRGAEGADPASVAFDAVARGVEEQADVVLVDTAGRLHTATGLMDQLGKVKRVVEKKAVVDEVLLVLDATVGQNGLTQARVFRDVVDITGVALTKLDGTAKGGIVFQVQEELGVPVKLVGLGEGADDLAPFEVEGFVDALLGGK
ncbi:signal recognition particle-docking protein FtsY [Corynebacterium humireducens NBRC 106098 = DSM 45392]|uniref:Signal recognition particle receptor FtsY n=1 Tax=Corynebacterium humireducens NBRC 106098 = DSM 45392 TaxID=1223515 RepID=A0A0B5DCM0_9CORY|nr:signal recognition particle-docking protein FtsY [Corynebacterium humireducens]AJE33524.1 signal recognition particle-docking protein FtsY [Corynebacterium humireducens NBRC 106098 = DSM 45392]